MDFRVVGLVVLSCSVFSFAAPANNTAARVITGEYTSRNHVFRLPLRLKISKGFNVTTLDNLTSRWRNRWNEGPQQLDLTYLPPEGELPGRRFGQGLYPNSVGQYRIELAMKDDGFYVREWYAEPNREQEGSWKEHEHRYRLTGATYHAYYEYLLESTTLTTAEKKTYELFRDITRGDLAKVQAELTQFPSINIVDPLGQTPLMVSLLAAQPAVTDAILTRKPSVDAESTAGKNAFDYALSELDYAGDASLKAVQSLVAYQLPRADTFRRTLAWAVDHRFFELARSLESKDGSYNGVALTNAALQLKKGCSDDELVAFMISTIKAGVPGEDGIVAEALVMKAEHFDLSQKLLDAGLNPSATGSTKVTLLMLAVMSADNALATHLIKDLKVDTEARDAEGYSAAAYAAKDLNTDMYYLLANGSNIGLAYGPKGDTLETLLADHFLWKQDPLTLIVWSESGEGKFINIPNKEKFTVLDKLVDGMSKLTYDFTRSCMYDSWTKEYGPLTRAYAKLTSIGAKLSMKKAPPPEFLVDPEAAMAQPSTPYPSSYSPYSRSNPYRSSGGGYPCPGKSPGWGGY